MRLLELRIALSVLNTLDRCRKACAAGATRLFDYLLRGLSLSLSLSFDAGEPIACSLARSLLFLSELQSPILKLGGRPKEGANLNRGPFQENPLEFGSS